MSGHMYGGGGYGAGSGAGAGSSGSNEKPELGLDQAAETSFVAFFRSMTPASEGTVRLFDRGDFYSAHGDAAMLVASTVFKTHSVLKQLGKSSKGGELSSVTLSRAAARDFLRDALTVKQLRVEIWAGGGKRSNVWTLAKQASPGNLQTVEDLLFTHADLVTSPIILALRLANVDGVRTVGAAFADASSRQLGLAQFADNDLFSNVESLVIQLGVKECLIPADEKDTDYDLSRLRTVLDRCNCVLTGRRKGDFQPKDVEQDLLRLLADTSAGTAQPEFGLKVSLGACAALISYLDLMTEQLNFGQYTIREHDLGQYLRLDASALRALSVFPEPGATGGNKSMSIYGLLNKCKTAQGQRMLAQWLKQPLVNVLEIRKRHTLVDAFVGHSEVRTALQMDQLRMMPDLHRISKRFQMGVATLEDVVRVYQAALRLPQMADLLSEARSMDESSHALDESFIAPFKTLQEQLSRFLEMVEETLDLDELEHHNFVIKAGFDDRLQSIKASLDTVRDNLDNEHRRVGKDLNMELDKKLHMENHSTYGYCLRLTRADAKVLSGKKKGYIELATIKNGVHFTTPVLRELSDDFRSLSEQYTSQQAGLVKDVIGIAASYCPPLERLNVLLANLDVLLSFAHVSACAPVPYTRPQIVEKGSEARLRVEEARHPCIEVQDDISFIANDVDMSPGESEFLIITGPNMGGKSTFIRQVGILALLSQVGCFVPAAEGARIPVFDCILARVGAGDSQLKGVSTFMSEMLETATILKTATKDSLIIIDELGRGTSTYDGFGLAWAISEWIATEIRCKTLFASHFAEITNLAVQQPHVKNLKVLAHVSEKSEEGAANAAATSEQDITLLYRVEPGIGDKSYGLHVAALAGFPDSILRLAKRKAEELEDLEDEDTDSPLKMPKDATDRGTALVEEFLLTWAKRSAALEGADDENVGMTNGSDPSSKRRRTVDPKAELAELRRTVEEFRPRCEADPWVKAVLESF
ncbi:putative DNA mismatch repair protein MSH2 [Ceraceosorus guamensis]|uniref:Putative DNA mismatch repair protein MSH2 n=1 Tax=Ceraceosorus guamensis TaxID=1522189 RepID=A0A316VP85_9BASI|nr:putative DNA mismatch repair protein MSH2 [Ceraceosorus guamensis]PWN39386.1 putative DNA mismatch repair protein MSH2 [Ceraceosorus guamensis]